MSALIELAGVSVAYGAQVVLRNASFSAKAGEFIGVIGPNGAGKSTLLKAGAGLNPISAGIRKLGGEDTDRLSPMARARRVCYLPQARPLYWSLTGRDIVALGRFAFGAQMNPSAQDDQAIDTALKDAGADHLAARHASALSGGELARLHLARMLAGGAPVMIADEPIAALDPAHQLSVMALLRAKASHGRAVIAALHDLSLAARYCTRVMALKGGTIVADSAPEEVLTEELMRDVFAVAGSVERGQEGLTVSLSPLDAQL